MNRRRRSQQRGQMADHCWLRQSWTAVGFIIDLVARNEGDGRLWPRLIEADVKLYCRNGWRRLTADRGQPTSQGGVQGCAVEDESSGK